MHLCRSAVLTLPVPCFSLESSLPLCQHTNESAFLCKQGQWSPTEAALYSSASFHSCHGRLLTFQTCKATQGLYMWCGRRADLFSVHLLVAACGRSESLRFPTHHISMLADLSKSKRRAAFGTALGRCSADPSSHVRYTAW